MSEKPLRVLVAEALGWTYVMDHDGQYETGVPPEWRGESRGRLQVPRYDTDWGAAGPLIDKHSICLSHCWPGDHGQDGFHWLAFRSGDVRSPVAAVQEIEGEGATPLEAVCRLILALHAAGKLNARASAPWLAGNAAPEGERK